jgi:hypothetical protein
MVANHTSLWAWVLPLVLSSPWVVGSIVFWRLRPRDGFVPPSYAQLANRR